METLLFITYAIASIALITAIWAVFEVTELRKALVRKQIQNRLRQVVSSTNTRPKGHWD